MKLYVIGNGFDIDHGIKSSYQDFHRFLEAKENDSNASLILYYFRAFYPFKLLWSDFEQALGCFNRDKYIEYYNQRCSSVYNDSQSKQNYIDGELDLFIHNLDIYFREWIQSLGPSIDSDNVKMNKQNKHIDINELFLTFNYTETLQKLYGVPEKDKCKFVYIHNLDREMISEEEFAQYIFGHNQKPSAGSVNETKIEQWIREFVDFYIKPVDSLIIKNNSFWENLKYVDEIFVLGHSMGDIDLPYFKKIVASINKNKVLWKISYYGCTEEDKNKDKKYKEKIMSNLAIDAKTQVTFKDNIKDLLTD